MTTLRHVSLANGLQIVFTDESNRYFGDYHRVCVVATIVCKLCDLPVSSDIDEALRCRAVDAFGEHFSVVKRFERMGVPSSDLDVVRTALIDDYLRHAAKYLARPDYLRSLVNAELKKRFTHRCYG
ncbi:MAG: hypothetical protein ACSLFH_06970 [Desulfuromonadales bacterium]